MPLKLEELERTKYLDKEVQSWREFQLRIQQSRDQKVAWPFCIRRFGMMYPRRQLMRLSKQGQGEIRAWSNHWELGAYLYSSLAPNPIR